MKSFACGDVVPGCTASWVCSTEDEILVLVARHASAEHGITSVAGAGGKRGFRVYPPWSPTDNAQAIRTQKWQGAYFLDTADGVDLDRLRMLTGQ